MLFKIPKVSVKFHRRQSFYLLCVLLIITVHCWIFSSANKLNAFPSSTCKTTLMPSDPRLL